MLLRLKNGVKIMSKCCVGILLGVATFVDASASMNSNYAKNSIDNYEQYDNKRILKKITDLQEKFVYFKDKANLYKEVVMNKMRAHPSFKVSEKLFQDATVRDYIFNRKNELKKEFIDTSRQNKNLISKIEAAKKQYDIGKRIVDDNSGTKKELYELMLKEYNELNAKLYQITTKLEKAREEELDLQVALLSSRDLKSQELKFSKINLTSILGVKDIATLEKENERLSSLYKAKSAKLEEMLKRNNYLQGEIYRVEQGLPEFK